MKGRGGSWKPAARALATLVAAAALALAACSGKSGTPTSSPTSRQSATPLPAPTVTGTIAFERVVKSEFETSGDIYVVSADGTGLKQLTDDEAWDESPVWSPDGNRIAWVVNDDSNPSVRPTFHYRPQPTIWVMNADGSGKVQLTTGAVHGAFPTWSPDGTRIAFLRYWPKKEAICVMNADGSDLRQVTPATTTVMTGYGYELFKWYVSPAWAPDGRIYYARVMHPDLFSMDPDGGRQVRLAWYRAVGLPRREFAISRAGQEIAFFTHGSHDALRLVAGPLEGGNGRVILLDHAERFFFPYLKGDIALSWTPDGKALALASGGSSESGSRIYVVNSDASGLSAVPGITSANDPDWRPQ